MAFGTHFAFNKFYSSQDAQKHTTVAFIEDCMKSTVAPSLIISPLPLVSTPSKDGRP